MTQVKRVAAEEFRSAPAQYYRAADKGIRVEVEHRSYSGTVFVLKAEEKEEANANGRDEA